MKDARRSSTFRIQRVFTPCLWVGSVFCLRVSPVGAWRAGGLGMDGKASGWVSLVEGLGKRRLSL
jgi:hypothetical protein